MKDVSKIDDQMVDLDILLSYSEIRKEVIWVEKNYQGGGALHLPIEDGDFEDSHIKYHIDNMESGKWEGYASDVKEGDKERFLKLAKDLIEMDLTYRELILDGSYITEKLFNYLYNDEEL